MGLRRTQVDENQLPFSNYSPRKHRPPPCHPDRSAAQWRDLRFGSSFLEMLFDRSLVDACESWATLRTLARQVSNGYPDRSVPGFPTSRRTPGPRVRFSVKETA
jgi:hypothetical protein